MPFTPYLSFDGDCADAFDFYKSVFGGEFTYRSTFADAPPDMGVSDEDKDKIMHVSLMVDDAVLMGSDVPKSVGERPTPANSISVTFTPKSKAEADAIFTRLAGDGGQETMPMQDTFWGAYFGMCKDKYGVSWMLDFTKE